MGRATGRRILVMFLPLGLVTDWRRTPWANVGLIAACVIAFGLSEFGASARAMQAAALWSRDPAPHAYLSHLFLHADWMHLVGNMIFLWCFGNAASGRLHPALYLAFFLVVGGVAGAVEIHGSGLEAHAQTVEHETALPRGIALVGASGAIMGVAGLCAVLYPFHRVRGLLVLGIFFRRIEIRTILLVLIYAALDLLYLRAFGHTGVAYAAHLGGFVAGAGVGLLLLLTGAVERDGLDLLARLSPHAPSSPPPAPRRGSRLLHQ